jgi:glutaconyl-CoA/methylmalonyl-CoA decarboxylase subunit delta
MSIPAEISFAIENVKQDHLIIFVVGYSVVFISLAFLWGVFQLIPYLMRHKFSWPFGKKPGIEREKTKSDAAEDTMSGEEAAAISMAIFLYVSQLHDEENRILTIKKISRKYSPWSSKIYSVTQGLNKRF